VAVLATNPIVSNPASTANRNVRVGLNLSAFTEVMGTSNGRLEGATRIRVVLADLVGHMALARGDCSVRPIRWCQLIMCRWRFCHRSVNKL